ncbi:hypothetical protein B0H15DRAFT_823076 [Mycena belliarum]|uniref:Uncharacterized protein n=1 Tax=Mycena belliarum TaxID=1033014 RepID=A0AAD6UB61_9AGAR|nr:hypothetical protein B0H15DRAFT_823076 [Mycena belliae]
MPAASDIELEDLSQRAPREAGAASGGYNDAVPDGVSAFWAWTTASLLTLISLILAVSPRLLLFVSQTADDPEQKRNVLTSLESFLALHAGIWLSAVAISLVLNIPSVPPIDVLPQHQQTARHPLLIPLTVAGSLSAFLAYNTKTVGTLASMVFVGSSIIGLCGAWVAVFGNSSSVSKKTGADKHTSSFIFGNKSAASVQKKRWLKQRTS